MGWNGIWGYCFLKMDGMAGQEASCKDGLEQMRHRRIRASGHIFDN
jgi:hypothetical protein